MKSYYFWTSQAARYQACVDFGSPISAWTQEMHDALDKCGGDRMKAREYLAAKKAEKAQ